MILEVQNNVAQISSRALFEAQGVTKSFEGNTVLQSIDFQIRSGEVHALVGENGAGKSTLMKILGGVYRADKGKLLLDGQPLTLSDPRDAIKKGIVVIHQELSLSPHLSSEENIFLGHYPHTVVGTVDGRKIRERTRQLLDQLAVHVDPTVPVRHLSIAQQQMVEIAKALSLDVRVLVLDEPTAVLDKESVATLFKVLSRLKSQGLGIVYISHHLDEVFRISDRVTVLRDGQRTGTAETKGVDHTWLINHMVGRKFEAFTSGTRKIGETVLEVRQLNDGDRFSDINLRVRAGEIVGLAGLVGAGRSEIAQTIVGARKRVSGDVYVHGKKALIRDVSDAIRQGIVYLPEDRKSLGLFLNRPVSENITMSNLKDFFSFPVLRVKREREFVNTMIRRLDVRLSDARRDVRELSGGNQQKVVLARSLASNPRVLILDEPTRGVDIGAKKEIYGVIEELVDKGMGILLISSEMEEVLRLADRVYVLRQGHIVKEMARGDASEAAIMNAAALTEDTHYD